MTSVQANVGLSGYLTKNLIVACLINAAMGLLYIWSLFLLPLESSLSVERSTLSIAPALALVTFTCGMAVHDRLLRALSLRAFALVSFALCGGGHILFGLFPSIWTLLIGYGLGFGFGAGLGYGLALALATRTPSRVRALSIGITVAAFAAGGVILSSLLASTIAETDPRLSFAVIGACLIALGIVIGVLLQGRPNDNQANNEARKEGPTSSPSLFSAPFLRLALSFFFICYVGLMVVSHIAGMLAAKHLSTRLVDLGPVVFTLGYFIGSLFGGKLVEAITGRPALIISNVLAAAGLGILAAPSGSWALVGALLVGAVFGSSASFVPTLIGEQYGSDQIGPVYGKLMVSYGTAGLLAPWLTGIIYANAASYAFSFIIGAAACAAGLLMALTMARSADGRASPG
jgi:MFS transporter, OFA family, oxalate/formate antiporter